MRAPYRAVLGVLLCAGVATAQGRVDNEATRALMVKFYELWKPGKLATATALKRA